MELVTLPETKQMDRQGEQQNGNATAMHTKETDKAERTDELTGKLLDIWEASLRTTHHFLAETDIEHIRPQAKTALRTIETLVVAYCETTPAGFIGIQNRKIEALFVAPPHIGNGLGKQLISTATDRYGAIYIDVNEQNRTAEAIYRHLGFETFGRDETDGEGNPFPILHMKLCGNLHK